MEFKGGNIQCRNIKNVASKCQNYVPDKIQFVTAGNPPGSGLAPDLYRSQSSTSQKEYYYFEPTSLTPMGTFTSGSNVLCMYHGNGVSRVVGVAGRGGGVVRDSTKFCTGRLCPKVQPLILLYSVIDGVPI